MWQQTVQLCIFVYQNNTHQNTCQWIVALMCIIHWQWRHQILLSYKDCCSQWEFNCTFIYRHSNQISIIMRKMRYDKSSTGEHGHVWSYLSFRKNKMCGKYANSCSTSGIDFNQNFLYYFIRHHNGDIKKNSYAFAFVQKI